jgi:hypothetical protein
LGQGTIGGDTPTPIRRFQSKKIVAFISSNTTRIPETLNLTTVNLGSLAQPIHDALENSDFETSQNANTPSWAIVVVPSLIVLADAPFFPHLWCLKLGIPLLSKVGAWKHGEGVQEFHPVVRKCIVWEFARLRGPNE